MVAVKKFVSIILSISLVLAFLPITSQLAYAAGGGDFLESNSSIPIEYFSAQDTDYDPPYEEGKINLTGKVSLADDKQLVQDLRWSFPFENPQRPGEGIADPGKPYKYVIWQSKKSTGSDSWSNWESRSGFGAENKVRVLNVYPHTNAEPYLRNWMNEKVVDPATGQTVPISRNILEVDTVYIDDFNSRPNSYLFETVQDAYGNNVQQYKYDVLMFGTYDGNNSKDLTDASYEATKQFADHGGGLMFGHDTLSGYAIRPYFNKFATNLGISLPSVGATNMSDYVKVVDSGFLTSRPWNLEGKTLNIPLTHNYGQAVPDNSGARVWMQMSDSAGNISGSGISAAGGTDNFYLVTKGSYAMIMTGHTSGGATHDESKVFANTLLYIAQGSRYTSGSDLSFADEDAPNQASAALSKVDLKADLDNPRYSVNISLKGASDNGTDFAYKIQGIPQATIEGDSAYREIWSTPDTSLTTAPDGSSITQTALSGLRGYYVNLLEGDSNKDEIPLAKLPAGATIIPASNAGDQVTYTSPQSLRLDTQYYAHVYAVDWAGNVSQDTVVPILVNKRTGFFHMNEETDSTSDTQDVYATSLFTKDGHLTTYPSDPTREGYRFDGWYYDNKAEGKKVEPFEYIPLGENDPAERPEHFYAKWVKTYDVVVSQRGKGVSNLTVKGDEAESVENQVHTFDIGTNLELSFRPSHGYHLASVWHGDQLLDPSEYENNLIGIPNLNEDQYFVIEFEPDDAVHNDAYNTVSTKISGDNGKSTITKTSIVEAGSKESANYQVSWNVDPNYEPRMIIVDGIERPDLVKKGITSITFPSVEKDHSVEVQVKPKAGSGEQASEYLISTELNGGPGSITPTRVVAQDGSHTVVAGVDDEYANDYELLASNIKVYDANNNELTSAQLAAAGITITEHDDGKLEVALPNVNSEYRVVATVTPKQQAGVVTIPSVDLLRIDTSVTGEGIIADSKIVKRGDKYVVDWKAADGWKFECLTVDGIRSYYPEGANEGEITLQALADEVEGDDKGNGNGENVDGDNADAEDPIVIDQEGRYPFSNIVQYHKVHALFVKDDESLNTDPDSEEAKNASSYKVITRMISEATGSITASGYDLTKGSDYPVSWTVPEGYEVTRVLVNGQPRPDLLNKGSFDVKNIQSDNSVSVMVEKKRAEKNGIQIKQTPNVLNSFLYEDVKAGDKVLPTLASHNADEATTWAQAQAEKQGKSFLGWTTDWDSKKLVTLNDALAAGYTTIYPVFGVKGSPGKPTNQPSKDPDDPSDPNNPNNPSDPDDPSKPDPTGKDDEPIDPNDPANVPGNDPTVDYEQTGYAYLNKTARNLTHPYGENQVHDTVRYYLSAQNNKLKSWTDVVLKDTLPTGVELKTDSVKLVKRALANPTQVQVETVVPGAYSYENGAFSYTIPAIDPGWSYCLIFDVELASSAVAADNFGKTVANAASVVGDSDGKLVEPDGTDSDEEIPAGPVGGLTEAVVLPDDGTVHWLDPNTVIEKTAKNISNPDSKFIKANDRIAYTITLKTDAEDSCIEDGVIFDTLPEGVVADPASIKLVIDGDEIAVDPSAHNAETGTIKVRVGNLLYGHLATLTFEAVVTGKAVGKSIPNTAYAFESESTSNPPDGGDDDNGDNGGDKGKPGASWNGDEPADDAVPSDPAFPNGVDNPVKYADATLSIVKTAQNATRSQGWRLNDTINYSIVVTNTVENSVSFNTVVEDTMSDGLRLDRGSIELLKPDGTRQTLNADRVFDANRNMITVPLDQVTGGETYTLTYKASIQEPSTLTTLKNWVTVKGNNDATGGLEGTILLDFGEAVATIPYPEDGKYGSLGSLLADTGDNPIALAIIALAAGLAVVLVINRKRWVKKAKN